MAGYGKQVGKLSLRVLPDASKFRADIDKLIERIERTKQIKLQVLSDTSQARRELERFHEKWNAEDINMNLRVASTRAREEMAVLTRPRSVTIKAETSKLSFAKVASQINLLTSKLSGIRVAEGVFEEFRESILNLDKSTGKISRVSLALANLGSTVTNSVGGIVTVFSDFLNIGNLALVLPAALAGAATGATALVLALKDMSTVLADLGPAFKAIQPVVSKAFWSEAEGPIRDLATTYLPALTKGMGNVGKALGNQFGTLADAFNTALGGGVFESFFDTLVKTIDIATGAVTPLVNAFVKMGEVGAAYLPDFAQWMTDVSNAFNDWVQQSAASGQMNNLIEAGVRAAQDLGRAAGGLVGIFYAINTAASAAGGTGLNGFANALQGASAILNSPAVQNALTTIFTGASEGLQQVGVGLTNFGQALVALAPTISSILALAGESLGTLITGISIALDQPEVKEGFTALFEGILKGVQGIVPALPVLFQLFGQLAGIVGELASQFGPLLGVLKETFAPVMESVLNVVEPLIPLLGETLRGAISALQGPMEGIAGFINDNADGLSKLALAAIVLVPAIQAGVKVFQAFKTVVSVIKGIQAGFIAASYGMQAATYATGAAAKVGAAAFKAWGVATKVWTAITKVAAVTMRVLSAAISANPIGAIITAITLLVGALIWFFTQTKLGKEIWANFVSFLSDAWGHIVDGWNGLVDGFQAGWKAVQDFFRGVIEWVKGIFGIHSPSKVFQDIGKYIVEGFVNGFQNLIQMVADVWNGLVAWFSSFWDGLMSFFGTWGGLILAVIAPFIGIPLLIIQNWDTIVAFLGTIWDGIVSLATTVFGAVADFFVNLWQGIVDFAILVWTTYVTSLTEIWNAIVTVATTVFTAVVDFFVNLWQGIVDFAMQTWSNFQLGLALIWMQVQGVAFSVFQNLVQFFVGIWDGISSTATNVWNAIVDFVVGVWNTWINNAKTVFNALSSFFSGIWNGIKDVVSTVWNAIVSAVTNAIRNVQNTISSILNTIKAMWNAGWQVLSSTVSNVAGAIRDGVSGMVSAVSNAIGNIGSTLSSIKDKVMGAISGAGTWLLQSGKAIIQGLIDGIGSMLEKAKNAASNVVGAIRDFFPFSPAKVGPFSGKGWTPYSGKALVQGLADGMTSKIQSVKDAARAVTEAASTTATVGLEETGSSLDSAYAARVAAGVPDYITIQGGVGYDPQSIAAEIALRKKQAALAAGLGMVQVR